MKIAIIGAGAMGSLFGAKLSEVPENKVYLIDVWKEHIDAINSQGIFVETNGEMKRYTDITACTDASVAGEADIVLVFVKSTITRQAVCDSACVFGPDTVALTLQNGLGNIELISELVCSKNVIGGTTANGATMLGPGKTRHAGLGKTVIGELSGTETGRIRAICDTFNKAGIETEISNNIQGLIWDKLIVNVGINALTGITKLHNGELIDNPELVNIMEMAVREAEEVAKSKGVKLGFEDAFAHTKDVCAATAKNQSSMLQDILNHRKTEIDMINGAIVREGRETGVDTTANAVLAGLIKFLEK